MLHWFDLNSKAMNYNFKQTSLQDYNELVREESLTKSEKRRLERKLTLSLIHVIDVWLELMSCYYTCVCFCLKTVYVGEFTSLQDSLVKLIERNIDSAPEKCATFLELYDRIQTSIQLHDLAFALQIQVLRNNLIYHRSLLFILTNSFIRLWLPLCLSIYIYLQKEENSSTGMRISL